MGDTVLEFKHISMEFPGVLANDDISLEIKKGEVFALVGENGAGKSTLMNILYGINEPTDGELYIKGQKVDVFSPKAAIDRGIGMVHQHFMLVPSFTVAQNIVLSREPKRLGLFFDNSAAEKKTRELSDTYGLEVEPSAVVREISVGLQQRVEILKTLYRGAEILILDEPTAVLTPQETEELFAVIRKVVRERDMTVIIIAHKLYEVMAISDRVGVMRKGKLIGVKNTCDTDERELASMMVGRPVLYEDIERSGELGDNLVEVKDLHVLDNRGLEAVKGVSLNIRAGEVLGIAAIEGNGQSELLEAITGMRRAEKGSVSIMGQDVTNKSPRQIRNIGLAHIPEDRISTGVSPDASVRDNLMMGKHDDKQFNIIGFHQNRKAIDEYSSALYEKYDIRGAGLEVNAGSMSGGNMQKLVVAREFSFDTPVLVISQPTRGVDVGAIEFIHRHILEKRNQGCAVLLSSADLDEVFRLSDRIVSLFEGRITGQFSAGEISKEEIGWYMTGSGKETAEHGKN